MATVPAVADRTGLLYHHRAHVRVAVQYSLVVGLLSFLRDERLVSGSHPTQSGQQRTYRFLGRSAKLKNARHPIYPTTPRRGVSPVDGNPPRLVNAPHSGVRCVDRKLTNEPKLSCRGGSTVAGDPPMMPILDLHPTPQRADGG